VGMLHDFDYEKYPTEQDHVWRGMEILRDRGWPEPLIKAIGGHAFYTNIPRETPMEKAILAADELTGFAGACALIRPTKKIADVPVESVVKRLKEKSFARSVDRTYVTRGAEEWGVPLPWAPDQVMYVWFDALLNYYTALGYAREGEDLTARYWPANRHIIAKDILKFHTVYWPAFLMAADLEPPQSVYVHGYLLMGEKKMSKSLGNVLDPFEVIDRFGADALRFYCFREVRFGQDGSISTPGFEARYESELANDFGNLASRTLAMVDRYRNAVVPDPPGGDAAPAAGDAALSAGTVAPAAGRGDPALADDPALAGLPARVCALLDEAELTEALDEIWTAVRRLNRYVEETRPWELAKSEEAADAERLDSALYSLTEGLRVVTLLLVPYLPQSTERLLGALAEPSRAASEAGEVEIAR